MKFGSILRPKHGMVDLFRIQVALSYDMKNKQRPPPVCTFLAVGGRKWSFARQAKNAVGFRTRARTPACGGQGAEMPRRRVRSDEADWHYSNMKEYYRCTK